MRVSPVALWARSEAETLDLAKKSAQVTHNHPEGIAGAQATALAIWLARQGLKSADIRQEIQSRFQYDLSRSVDEIRPNYAFDVTCAGSVPQALSCALEATSFEDAIRNAISIGGDSDTIASIAGGYAEVAFGVPDKIVQEVRARLNDELLQVIDLFYARLEQRF